MLHIAICDDEKDFVTHLTKLIQQYATETGEELKVTTYYDGMELVEQYDTIIDLIFLDIQMACWMVCIRRSVFGKWMKR